MSTQHLKFLMVLFFSFSSLCATSQGGGQERGNFLDHSIPDTVRNQLELVSQEQQEVGALLPLVDQLSRQDPSLAWHVLQKLFIDKMVRPYGEVWAKLQYYKTWLEVERYAEDEALALLKEQAEEFAQFFTEQKDFHWLAKSYSLLSMIHYNISYNNDDSLYLKASEYNQQALELIGSKKEGNSHSILGELYRIKGNICFYQRDCPSTAALNYYAKGLNYYERNGDASGQADIILNQGIITGIMEERGHDFQQSKTPTDYFEKALTISDELNDIQKVRINYAKYLRAKFDATRDKKWYEQSNQQAFAIVQSDRSNKSDAYLQLAMNTQAFLSYFPQDLSEAEQLEVLDSVMQYYYMTLTSCREENNLKVYNKILQQLSILFPYLVPYFSTERCSQLLTHADEVRQYFMRLDKTINQKITANNKVFQKEIEAQKRKIFLQRGGFILCAVVIGFSILFYQLRIKSIRKTLDAKQEALRAQMNPHFISNTINAIESLVNQEENIQASEYLIDFSRLCRLVIEHSRYSSIGLDQEIDALRYFLSLEKLRLADDMEYSISIDDRLVLDDIRVPPLILQPFVENAIWHGIKNKPEPINGELKIEINWLSDHQIEYIIEDNGVGREQAKAIQKESAIDKKSWGVSLTKDRIDYLQNGKGASLQFVDLYDANQRPRGTKVIVHLPTVRKNNN